MATDSHTCHAYQCQRAIKPELFMCAYHWRMVPAQLKARIWANYVKGQCNDWRLVTRKYADSAQEAIKAVAVQENHHLTGSESCLTLYDLITGTQRQPGLFGEVK